MPTYLVVNREMLARMLESTRPMLRPQMQALWFHILLNTRYGEKDRGIFKTSLPRLVKETGLSMMTVRSLLKCLQSNRQVTNQVTNKGRTLTVVNYDSWVLSENGSNKQDNRQVTPVEVRSKESLDIPNGISCAINRVAEYYRTIQPKARLTKGAESKIKTRLGDKEFSEVELCEAIDKFKATNWWMRNNGKRGMEWFFRSEGQIARFIDLEPEAENERDKKQNPEYYTEPTKAIPLEEWK